jgi:GNAT superfamily N-acetyltransferase
MIRQFHPDDAAPCVEVVHACIRFDPWLSRELRELLIAAESAATLRERAKLHYVAVEESEGRIGGVGGIDLNEIRLLFVDPGRQGTGIGGALLGHLEALAPPALFPDVFVYATPSAEGFYRSRGYAARGRHGFDVRGTTIPTVFMVKDLRRPRP